VCTGNFRSSAGAVKHPLTCSKVAEFASENLDRDTRGHAWHCWLRAGEIRQSWEVAPMSLEVNKELIRRYLSAVDSNEADDWDLLDDYIAEGFVAHNAPAPGVTLDRPE
jgi:hypothetical protein